MVLFPFSRQKNQGEISFQGSKGKIRQNLSTNTYLIAYSNSSYDSLSSFPSIYSLQGIYHTSLSFPRQLPDQDGRSLQLRDSEGSQNEGCSHIHSMVCDFRGPIRNTTYDSSHLCDSLPEEISLVSPVPSCGRSNGNSDRQVTSLRSRRC